MDFCYFVEVQFLMELAAQLSVLLLCPRLASALRQFRFSNFTLREFDCTGEGSHHLSLLEWAVCRKYFAGSRIYSFRQRFKNFERFGAVHTSLHNPSAHVRVWNCR